MLSIAIKNAILTVIIILIFHFLIKKYLFELSLQLPPVKPKKTIVEKDDETVKPTTHQLSPTTPLPPPVPESIPPAKPKKSDDELLNFVFENTLELPKQQMPPPASSSGISATTTEVVKTTTNPTEPNAPMMMKNAEKFTVINEYDNESVMNGGQIFQGISGYDGPNSNFVSLDVYFNNPLS